MQGQKKKEGLLYKKKLIVLFIIYPQGAKGRKYKKATWEMIITIK
jgi:hypothetical protein